jgi:deoxyribodipyrimidine photo-lyase
MMNRRNIDIEKRIRLLSEGKRGEGPVVYWMSRDQRVFDNWALLWAQQEALVRRKGLLVVFCVTPDYPGVTRSMKRNMIVLKVFRSGLVKLWINIRMIKDIISDHYGADLLKLS